MRSLFLTIATCVLLASRGAAVPSLDVEKRQTTSKYCSPDSNICYLEIATRGTNPVYRIAIPDGSAAPFDTLLQIISPVSLGWAGFAWGGGMTLNPLTVAWPNGNKAVVSSRWASGHTAPTTYSQATYKTLSSSKNATHWTIEVVCSGCSKWSGGQLSTSGLNTFAFAVSKTPVSQPASSSSAINYHSNFGMLPATDLSAAKVPLSVFQQYVKSAGSA
ncbi:hypothetical protein B0T17DRAFT_589870 [Bombardia bombarda]|uniref:Cellobiose dehydrogenase-like cytochrome domain-containing protein n=1 Tax=Bombardia bombarda TaxID=252184 RepID=A0AA39XAF0_9PEZI|nr:hypothetical protein B0T17DRAFT_589870 [Bombardia bombarda]